MGVETVVGDGGDRGRGWGMEARGTTCGKSAHPEPVLPYVSAPMHWRRSLQHLQREGPLEVF